MTTGPADMTDEELAEVLASFPRRSIDEMSGVTKLSGRQVESIERFIGSIEKTAEGFVCRRNKYDEEGLADAAVSTTEAIKRQCEALKRLLAGEDLYCINGLDKFEMHTEDEWAELGMRVDRGRPCRFDKGDGLTYYATWAVRPFKSGEKRRWERKRAAEMAQNDDQEQKTEV